MQTEIDRSIDRSTDRKKKERTHITCKTTRKEHGIKEATKKTGSIDTLIHRLIDWQIDRKIDGYRYYYWLANVHGIAGEVCPVHFGKAGCLPSDPVSESGEGQGCFKKKPVFSIGYEWDLTIVVKGLNHEKYGNTIKWRFVDDRSPDTWGIISIHSGNPFWQTSTMERRNRLNTAQIGPRNPPIQTTQGLVGSLKIKGWCIAHCCRFGPQCRWWKVLFVKAVWLGLLADNCFFWDFQFLSVNHILW